MDLLNQTLNSFFTLISDEGVSLNLDIFGANLINITLLVVGLFYLLRKALNESLSKRRQKILRAIQVSEASLKEGTRILTDTETFMLIKVPGIIKSLQKDEEQIALSIKSSILTDGKTKIERLTATTKTQIATIEARVRKKIYNYVATLALQRITMQLEGKLNLSLQQQLIDRELDE